MPWSAASGTAAGVVDAVFSDDYLLIRRGLPPDVVEEVTRRTPGFTGWQQD